MIRLNADSACFRAVAAATLVSLALSGPAQAGMSGQIVLDQQPTRRGGPFSDTLFLFQFQERSQRMAEDMLFAETQTIGGVNWWGFYDEDNPPIMEEFRIRFYSARPADGLPDEVLAEYPAPIVRRTATGIRIPLGVSPREYFYEVALASPIAVPALTKTWVEIVQIGDLATGFRWEDGLTGGGQFAAVSPVFGPDWVQITGANRSLQLVAVPEPALLTMLALAGFRRLRFSRSSQRC